MHVRVRVVHGVDGSIPSHPNFNFNMVGCSEFDSSALQSTRILNGPSEAVLSALV